ncbi:MAG: hypothetical protein ACKVPX_14135 [Myxococcaceae bacterium]
MADDGTPGHVGVPNDAGGGGGGCDGGYGCGGTGGGGTLPDVPVSRLTVWQPGIPGGIPTDYVVHSTVLRTNGDMTATIQNALNSAGAAASENAGRIVLLGAGVYEINSTLRIPSDVVLRGAGVGNDGQFLSQLRSPGPGFTLVMMGNDNPTEVQSVNLASDGTKGSRSVTLTSDAANAGFAAGQLVLLDELTDNVLSKWVAGATGETRSWYSRYDRPISDVFEVESVSGNTVTFKSPIHIAMRVSQSAQLTRFLEPPTRKAGVEALRVTTGHNGSDLYGYDRANVMFAYAIDSWARHFEADGSAGKSVGFRMAHRCVAREGYVHDTQYWRNGGWGYGFDFTDGSSNNLVENSISIRFNKVTNFRGAGGGNVFAYNFTDDGAISWDPGWVETGLQASHYPTPHYELFEGNYGANADGDSTFGNAIYITFFRNHLAGKRRLSQRPSGDYGGEAPQLFDSGNLRCASASAGHVYYNYVANVLGTPGMSGFEYEAPASNTGAPAVWRIGALNDWSAFDPEVRSTMLRDGNWDYITQLVHWHGIGDSGSSARTLPDSLYLGSKPAFFGSLPWPWVDPTGSVKVQTLPAKARYDMGTPNVIP